MDKNIRYFTYKYNILYDDWFNDLNNIYLKINAHIHNMSNNDDVCTAGAIKELCEARDSGLPQFVNGNQLSSMIDLLCTKQSILILSVIIVSSYSICK